MQSGLFFFAILTFTKEVNLKKQSQKNSGTTKIMIHSFDEAKWYYKPFNTKKKYNTKFLEIKKQHVIDIWEREISHFSVHTAKVLFLIFSIVEKSYNVVLIFMLQTFLRFHCLNPNVTI